MPDRPESTPAPDTTPDDLPAARPQVHDPDDYDDTQGFRETMLLYITDPAFNASLRVLAGYIYTLSLDYNRWWPSLPGNSTVWEMEAALADLRHLEGFLARVAKEREEHSGLSIDHELATLAGREVRELQAIGDRIEAVLTPKLPAESRP
jgi:hypothetical protein